MFYGYFRAIDEPMISVVLTIFSLGTQVLLAYLLSAVPSIGYIGIWASIPIGWALADLALDLYSPAPATRQLGASLGLAIKPAEEADQLGPDIQLCLEVAAPAVKSLLNFAKDFSLTASVRKGKSILGNKLVDLYAENWDKIEEVNQQLLAFNGVVASSLFDKEVTSVITVQDGQAVEIGKGENHD